MPAQSVAIVHDYLNQPGGAERTVLEMANIWPSAPIYTSLYRPESTFPEFAQREVRASLLNRLPVDRHFRALAPLYPVAFSSFGALKESVVISSSSGWAHGVRTHPSSTHIVYCYAPARWLYSSAGTYVGTSRKRTLFAPMLGLLRRWDQAAARRADAYISIARNVRDRVRSAYGLDSEVVYPPVDISRFTPRPRGERLLVVSRLLPYKRVDLAVRAANATGLGLDVVGDGPMAAALRRLAGPTVTFHGQLRDAEVTRLMEHCRTVVVPGAEDFGIVPIEANAAGKPVVAFAAGGALETLEEGATASFFHTPTVDCVVEAIQRSDALNTPPETLAVAARRFSTYAFAVEFRAAVERAVQRTKADKGESAGS